MNRTAWLQDRRMQNVLSRWERGALSMMEAGELLGMSERQVGAAVPRRCRERYEEEVYFGTGSGPQSKSNYQADF
jgi:hypothetical protein